jgi:hypothetical protein
MNCAANRAAELEAKPITKRLFPNEFQSIACFCMARLRMDGGWIWGKLLSGRFYSLKWNAEHGVDSKQKKGQEKPKRNLLSQPGFQHDVGLVIDRIRHIAGRFLSNS